MNPILFVLPFVIGAPILMFIFAKLVQRANKQAQRNIFLPGQTPGRDGSDDAARQAIMFATFASTNLPDSANNHQSHKAHHSPDMPAPDHHSHHSGHGEDGGQHHSSAPSSFDSGTSHSGGSHH